MPEWVPINLKLISVWQNWIIILLMLIIAGVAMDLLATVAAPGHAPVNSVKEGK